ncbi:MAG: VacJ family lipoprotein [bacterium]|nr:VacJ family lipoprotein [bacterium]
MMRGLLIAAFLVFAVPSFADEPQASASAPDWDELDELLLEDDWLQPDPADRDPLEGMNRNTHDMNEGILVWVVDPLNRAYRFVMPSAARRSVVRFFSNLSEPAVLVNDLFQFAPLDASETGARFLINTTVGVAGLFDPATSIGLPGHKTDFGETLAAYRAPSGPYFVVPILGPSTIRDAIGQAVDLVMRPDIWLLGLGSVVLVSTGSGMATYDIQKGRLEALRETSVDYYAALRGAYLLDRDARVEKRVCGLAWRSCEAEDVVEAAVSR